MIVLAGATSLFAGAFQAQMPSTAMTTASRIRVTSLTDPSTTDMSDANFTIGGTVTVTSPNGGRPGPLGVRRTSPGPLARSSGNPDGRCLA